MKTSLAAGAAMLVFGGSFANAHRLDEYLQATMISVEKDRVQAQIRLTPGVAVFPSVLADIDANADGVISDAELRSYGERVLHDVSLAIDGTRLALRMSAWKLTSITELKEGRGAIQIDFDAVVPRGGPDRRLTFQNHHRSRMAVYLVNVLAPRDPDIRVTGQSRSYEQSFYQLDYTEAGAGSGPRSLAWWLGTRGWLGVAVLLSLAQLAVLSRRRPADAERAVAEGAGAL